MANPASITCSTVHLLCLRLCGYVAMWLRGYVAFSPNLFPAGVSGWGRPGLADWRRRDDEHDMDMGVRGRAGDVRRRLWRREAGACELRVGQYRSLRPLRSVRSQCPLLRPRPRARCGGRAVQSYHHGQARRDRGPARPRFRPRPWTWPRLRQARPRQAGSRNGAWSRSRFRQRPRSRSRQRFRQTGQRSRDRPA